MKIAFLCVENSNRSQLAEAFARLYAPPGVEIYSAGSRPSGKVSPMAIAAMRELGVDISGQSSKGLADIPQVVDYAVTMGCGDACPALQAAKRIDWPIPEPKHLALDEYRQIRDQIGRLVKALLDEAAGGR
jgi:protein-tyrosine-phosphatase